MAAATTDAAYARAIGLTPALNATQLDGALLFCGAFDLALTEKSTGLGKWFVTTALWAYTGTKDFADDPDLVLASVADHLTDRFPPSFISAGNGDPLLAHSEVLASRLEGLGVATDTLFFPAELEPSLPHEYQFDLARPEGREALDRALAFLAQVTAPDQG